MYTVETHYLDVGQGDCSVILVKDTTLTDDPVAKFDGQIKRVLVFDCGSSGGRKAGEKLLEVCRELRIEKIDVIVISHFDKDHFNGFNYLFFEPSTISAEVKRLFYSTKLYTIGLIFKQYRIRLKGKKGRFQRDIVSRYKMVADYPEIPELLSSFQDYDKFLNGVGRISEVTDFEHVTERVYSGFPDGKNKGLDQPTNFLVNKDEWNPTRSNDAKSDVKNFVEVTFEPEGTHTILGQDLMNLNFPEKFENIHLWCLAYNGHLLEDFHPSRTVLKSRRLQGKDTEKSSKVANRLSIACLLKFDKYSAWFGGDLPTEHEDKLTGSIRNCIGDQKLSTLKASHHGSNDSTSEDFIWDLQPLQTIVTCGRGVANVKSDRREGTSGEENSNSHPGIHTIARLTEWYNTLFEHEFNPDYGVFTTWMSRDRVYESNYGTRLRMNEYFDEFGKDFITITNSTIHVQCHPDGRVEYPNFETHISQFIPSTKNAILPSVFDQFQVDEVMNQSIELVAQRHGLKKSDVNYRFVLDDNIPYRGEWKYFKRSKKKRDREEQLEVVNGTIRIVGEGPAKKKRNDS